MSEFGIIKKEKIGKITRLYFSEDSYLEVFENRLAYFNHGKTAWVSDGEFGTGMSVLNGQFQAKEDSYFYGDTNIVGKVEFYNKITGTINRGANWVLVRADGTPRENAMELQEKYIYARSQHPNGKPLSATNRFTVLLSPGSYDFGEATFVVTDEFVDLVSITGDADVEIQSSEIYGQYMDGDTPIETVYKALSIQANDVLIKGIRTIEDYEDDKNKRYICHAIALAENLNKLRVINCIAGCYSFIPNFNYDDDTYGALDGYFKNIRAGLYSFQGSNILGTFENIEANFSFNADENISGTFKDIKTNSSFVSDGNISGSFKNILGYINFNAKNNADISGSFENCNGDIIFRGNKLSGIFRNCIGGSDSFNAIDEISGNFIDCECQANSFLANTISGTFLRVNFNDSDIGRYNTVYSPSNKFIKCIGSNYSGIIELGANVYDCTNRYGFLENTLRSLALRYTKNAIQAGETIKILPVVKPNDYLSSFSATGYDINIATCSFDMNTQEIIITGVAPGVTTFTFVFSNLTVDFQITVI